MAHRLRVRLRDGSNVDSAFEGGSACAPHRLRKIEVRSAQ